MVTAIPAAIPASPSQARAAHSTRTWSPRAAAASSGSQAARPRTNSSGKATESAIEATIHGAR